MSAVPFNDRRTGIARRARLIVLLCTVAACGVAALNISRLRCISRDGIHFIQFAGQLRDNPTHYLVAHRSQPGYSTLILGTHSLLKSMTSLGGHECWQLSGQIIAATGYVACIPLLFLLARRLFDTRIACIAALLAVFWPQAAQLGGDVLSDMPHLALYLSAMLLGGRAIFGPPPPTPSDPADAVPPLTAPSTTTVRLGLLALAGIMSSLAYYVRQEALVIPAALTLMLWWHGVTHLAGRWPRRLGLSALSTFVLCSAFLAPQIPYIRVTGALMHKKGWRDLFVKRTAEMPAATPPYVMVPVKLVEAWARSGRYILSTLGLLAVLIPQVSRPQRHWRNLVLLLLIAQALAVERRVANFGEFSTRYALIPAALTLPWAAALLSVPRRGVLLAAPLVGVLAWFALEPINRHDAIMREAGMWLRKNMAQQSSALAGTRAARVMYYADRSWHEVRQWRPSLQDMVALDELTNGEAAWCVVVVDPEHRAADDQLIDEICRHTRWRGSTLEREWYDDSRAVKVIRLQRNR